ncbi:hypothetical protein BKA56DRAFT_682144 [Ilyonectria sp. MPI-CAGE-AT-0026]|nr:hypothetical protein BKA56DRAFT_682144 [Ilyonectria sp. MPI-CAGE-AT-0026]
MENASDEMLELQDRATELQNGATTLDLPPETAGILNDLRKVLDGVIPTEQKDKEAIIYFYDTECADLSNSIASQKAQSIKETLSMVHLKRAAGVPIRGPRIYGLDRGGFKTEQGFVGVSVLVSDSVEASIERPGRELVPYTWTSGVITLFMENTTLMLPRLKEDEEKDASSKHRGRTIYFYLMIPVQRQD